MPKKLTLFTDGACLGNPGPGGYAAVLIFGGQRREISGGYRLTTNNRMELMGAIAGLEALVEPCEVTLYSDSRYLVENMNSGAVARWQANNWKRNQKEKALNVDLWERFLRAAAPHDLRLVWVQGHAGETENERCDRLSVLAARRRDLPPDPGYQPAPVTPRLF